MLDVICTGAAQPCSPPLEIARVATSAFLAILFLQSGIDKVVDRTGNLEWLTGHFAKSPLAAFVPVLLTTVTIAELLAGAASALGACALLLGRGTELAVLGSTLSVVSLLMLFFGQRMAKDYAGAGLLVPYFLLALAGLFLLA